MSHKIIVVGHSKLDMDLMKEIGDATMGIEEFVEDPKKFSLALFTGGADVTPSLYKEKGAALCFSDIYRDLVDKAIYDMCTANKVKKIGICRGLQFINVMEGGKLIHHLDGHEGGQHLFECFKDDKLRKVNSLHHQMVIPPKNPMKAVVVGWSAAKLSKNYYGNNDERTDWKGPEVEAVIYPRGSACGVQYHPEMMDKGSPGRTFFVEMAQDLLNLAMIDFISKYAKGREEPSHGAKDASNN